MQIQTSNVTLLQSQSRVAGIAAKVQEPAIETLTVDTFQPSRPLQLPAAWILGSVAGVAIGTLCAHGGLGLGLGGSLVGGSIGALTGACGASLLTSKSTSFGEKVGTVVGLAGAGLGITAGMVEGSPGLALGCGSALAAIGATVATFVAEELDARSYWRSQGWNGATYAGDFG